MGQFISSLRGIWWCYCYTEQVESGVGAEKFLLRESSDLSRSATTISCSDTIAGSLPLPLPPSRTPATATVITPSVTSLSSAAVRGLILSVCLWHLQVRWEVSPVCCALCLCFITLNNWLCLLKLLRIQSWLDLLQGRNIVCNIIMLWTELRLGRIK